jgi:hypothetical protein
MRCRAVQARAQVVSEQRWPRLGGAIWCGCEIYGPARRGEANNRPG